MILEQTKKKKEYGSLYVFLYVSAQMNIWKIKKNTYMDNYPYLYPYSPSKMKLYLCMQNSYMNLYP